MYKRYDVLTAPKVMGEILEAGTSFIISILASLIFELKDKNIDMAKVVFVVVVAVNFLLVVFSRYAIKGRMNSYQHMIKEYELKRLKKKIDSMEHKTICTDGDVLIAKQVILTELCKKKKWQKKKEKEELVSKIKEIEQLDVCLKRKDNLKKYEYEVNGEKIYLSYQPDEKENENWNETDETMKKSL